MKRINRTLEQACSITYVEAARLSVAAKAIQCATYHAEVAEFAKKEMDACPTARGVDRYCSAYVEHFTIAEVARDFAGALLFSYPDADMIKSLWDQGNSICRAFARGDAISRSQIEVRAWAVVLAACFNDFVLDRSKDCFFFEERRTAIVLP